MHGQDKRILTTLDHDTEILAHLVCFLTLNLFGNLILRLRFFIIPASIPALGLLLLS